MPGSNEPIHILMVGPSSRVNGGMTTLMEHLLAQSSDRLCMRHVATHEEGPLHYKIWFFLKSLGVLLVVIPTVDVLHVHMSESGSSARKGIVAILAFLFNKPVIIHTHGGDYQRFHNELPAWGKWLMGWILRHCHCVITLSNSWQKFFADAYGLSTDRLPILPSPVIAYNAPTEPVHNDVVQILFLGRLVDHKGVFDLLNAFSQLSPALRKQTRLVLAGDGEVNAAKAQATALGLDDTVDIPGWVSGETRTHLLSQSHLFVLPSYFEGLPMAILEAMGCGLPVISTPVGGIPEIITAGKNGLLVQPGDIAGLQQAIQHLVEDRSTRDHMGRQAYESVKPYAFDAYWAKLEAIYHLAYAS